MRFKHIIIFQNPKSTNAEKVKQKIALIKKMYGKKNVTILQTSAQGDEENQNILEKHAQLLGTSTLLCVAAGDGTTHGIIQALLSSKELQNVRSTPVLPIWGGNANDLAVMLNGSDTNNIEYIIEQGKLVKIYPLKCVVKKSKSIKTYLATNYLSFGASAKIAHKINSPEHRKSRLHKYIGGKRLQELITGAKALFSTSVAKIKTKAGRRKTMFESIYANGPRMARLSSLPIELTDKAFYQITIPSNKFFSVLQKFLHLFTHHFDKKSIKQTHPISFIAESDIYVQFDGEAELIRSGSEVTIAIHESPFYSISTM